jgi:asparagine synthase (glutamine-hydrolysing)
MCGLVGFIQRVQQNSESLTAIISHMADGLLHRGPDDAGVWVDEVTGLALGHRRLSILDLSAAGHQPMVSATGRYLVVYNGEIYNFSVIKKELEECDSAIQWRGHSDTEVLLAAIEKWGVEQFLTKSTGMFAFALWDREARILYLARDRMGEKPLYYGINNNIFFFGSELKALQRHPAWSAEVDREVLALFLRFTYIPAPYSIFKGIYKLPPGTYIRIPLEKITLGQNVIPAPVPYWSIEECVVRGINSPFTGTDEEAIANLEILLKDSVKNQMVADVPVGAFLSGGIDSSLITALMQGLHSQKVKTFSIGFYEEDYNEAENARKVADYIGTDHTELYVLPKDALRIIPDLSQIYDEPFADDSQVPTYLLSRLTREQVTVSLSGDGGDELFGGYSRYMANARRWDKISPIPQFLRTLSANILGSKAFSLFGMFLCKDSEGKRGEGTRNSWCENLITLKDELPLPDFKAFYKYRVSIWKNLIPVRVKGKELATAFDRGTFPTINHEDIHSTMMYKDALVYLPDDILVKVDRAAMAVSLETRVPMLDHRVVEFAWQLPMGLKIRGDQKKWILKELLYRHVPAELVNRPKMGFGVPIGSWLRGPLKEWAEDLLDPGKLRQDGYLQANVIRQTWQEHLSGRQNHQAKLWAVLMFQSWLKRQHIS